VHAGQSAGQMHLDADARRADPGQPTAVDDGDRHANPPIGRIAPSTGAHAERERYRE
jgi:hypothetical protein